MNEEAAQAIAKGLWRYYETGLGDTPFRVTKVIFYLLDEAGFEVVKKGEK